jgi:hypothetical protein
MRYSPEFVEWDLSEVETAQSVYHLKRGPSRQIQLTALAKIKSSPHAAGLRDLLE